MTSAKTVKPSRSRKKPEPELSAEEQQKQLERANQIREQRAETQLDLAKLFVEHQKVDVALRRLQEIVAEFGGTSAAKKAQAMIKKL